ncbi:unnamed protein product [Paramecium pentaurelia]|uniref:Uncharacterized protein n=1 Tax=Paramecium pentaurelia TaxID=43138 RepID=A0A8S1TTZ8_9CILI|nr:unnamed protein product [Paramecium pentaurelia]
MCDSQLFNFNSPLVLNKQRRIINLLPNEIDIEQILKNYRINNKIEQEVVQKQQPSKNMKNPANLMRMKRVILNQFNRPNSNKNNQQKCRENFQEQFPYFLRIQHYKITTQPNSLNFMKLISRDRLNSLDRHSQKNKSIDFSNIKTRKMSIQQYEITAWTRKTSESL